MTVYDLQGLLNMSAHVVTSMFSSFGTPVFVKRMQEYKPKTDQEVSSPPMLNRAIRKLRANFRSLLDEVNSDKGRCVYLSCVIVTIEEIVKKLPKGSLEYEQWNAYLDHLVSINETHYDPQFSMEIAEAASAILDRQLLPKLQKCFDCIGKEKNYG